MDGSLEHVEKVILDNVKFINLMLQEIRKRNTSLREDLGMSYAKLVGLGTPYEEAIHAMRQVKAEFDGYLKVVRGQILKKYESKSRVKKPHKKP